MIFEPRAAVELLGIDAAEFDRMLLQGIIPPARVDGFRRYWLLSDLRPVLASIHRTCPIPSSAEYR